MITKEDVVLTGIVLEAVGTGSPRPPYKIFSNYDVDFILFNSIECNIKIYEDIDSEHILDYLVGHINDKINK